MFWIQLVVVAGVIFTIAAVVLGAGGMLPEAHREQPESRMPEDRPLTAEDVDQVRFPVVLRGYRMGDVDDILDRLTAELLARDARIMELEYKLAGTAPAGVEIEAPVAVGALAGGAGDGRLSLVKRNGASAMTAAAPGPLDAEDPEGAASRVSSDGIDDTEGSGEAADTAVVTDATDATDVTDTSDAESTGASGNTADPGGTAASAKDGDTGAAEGGGGTVEAVTEGTEATDGTEVTETTDRAEDTGGPAAVATGGDDADAGEGGASPAAGDDAAPAADGDVTPDRDDAGAKADDATDRQTGVTDGVSRVPDTPGDPAGVSEVTDGASEAGAAGPNESATARSGDDPEEPVAKDTAGVPAKGPARSTGRFRKRGGSKRSEG